MPCAILYHLYNLKNAKNNHGGVLLFVKLQAEACKFTKNYTPPWVYRIFKTVQMVPNCATISYSHIIKTIPNAKLRDTCFHLFLNQHEIKEGC